MFALSLTFFKENLATYIAVLVLLPLSAVLNWRLSLVLVALVVVFATVTLFVIRRTQAGQGHAEAAHSALAGRAQDALSPTLLPFSPSGGCRPRRRHLPKSWRT